MFIITVPWIFVGVAPGARASPRPWNRQRPTQPGADPGAVGRSS